MQQLKAMSFNRINLSLAGTNNVHVRNSGSNDGRMTLCVAAAASGVLLPGFVVVKGTRGAADGPRWEQSIEHRVAVYRQEIPGMHGMVR
jgi:hypothetical protein